MGGPALQSGEGSGLKVRHALLFVLTAFLPPLVAEGAELAFHGTVAPWLFFNIAVLISGWIGGIKSGLTTTLASVAIVWWFFIPPQGTPASYDPRHFASAAVFVIIGAATSECLERLRRSKIATAAATQALKENHRVVQAVIDYAPGMVVVKNLEGRILLFNRRFAQGVGVSDDQLRGRLVYDLFSPDDARRRRETDRAVIDSRQAVSIEEDVALKDGRHVFLASAFPLLDERGDAFGVCWMETDITARKRAEQELARTAAGLDAANKELRSLRDDAERAAARTRDVIELSPDAYFQANLDGRITEANQAAHRMLGFEQSELIGTSVFDLVPRADVARVEAMRAELLVPGTENKGEWTLLRKDGTSVPVESSINILRDGRWQAFARDITERKRIEDQRRVGAALLDNSVDFVGIADPSGKAIYLNPAGRRMVGLAPDFPIKETQILDFYPPEARQFATDVIRKAVMERGAWAGETIFQHFQTQARIPVWNTNFLIHDVSGERILGLGSITHDITEPRRIAEEREQALIREREARQEAEVANTQLRDSEERFRLTLDEGPIGMALVGLDGRFARVNRVLCEITGYTREELVGRKVREITHPEDIELDVPLAERLRRGDFPRYQAEKRYIRKDGSIFDGVLSVSVLRGSDNAALELILRLEDITSRKQAERALRRSEAKFSGIISIAADAIISVDPQQRITIFNEGAQRIFGYSTDEVIGTQLERLIPERLRAAHRQDFAGFAAGEQTARTMVTRQEVFGLRKTGDEFPAEASISKVTVGDETFFSVVLRDITNRRNAQIALQRAVTARDEMFQVVAHDLRNPLSAIMMAAQMMEEEGPKPERPDAQPHRVILRAATRMNQLIQDLLDVALAEAGQLRMNCARLSVSELVRDIVELETPITSAAGLEFQPAVEDGAVSVWGDRQRILQVLENLIGNAVKFTRRGGAIVVSAVRKGEDVAFSVRDSGAGIAPDVAERVFERFEQAPTKQRTMGAGLGLAIVKAIVEAHGGSISLETKVGRGSTFTFTIPTAPPEPRNRISANRGGGLRPATRRPRSRS